MKQLEKLVILTAMEKALKSVKSEVKSDTDRQIIEAYQETGAKSFDLILGGEKVGTFSLAFSEPEIYITDRSTFEDWAQSAGFLYTEDSIDISKLDIDKVREVFPDAIKQNTTIDSEWKRYVFNKGGASVSVDGEIVPGVAWTSREIKNTITRVPDEKAVLALITPQDVQLLLEGSDG